MDNDFVEKYKLAVTGKDRSDTFFNKLADQNDCFTIYLLCILKATKPDTRLMVRPVGLDLTEGDL